MTVRVSMPILVLLVLPAAVSAGEPVDYLRDIKPLVEEKCFACHGGLQQKAGLRVDTAKLMLEGGDRGAVIVPGKSGQSKLIDHITGKKGFKLMPPATDGEPFSPAQVATIRNWIDQGAKGPADEKPEADPREHWAFRPPAKPLLPKLNNAAGSNPIDHFIVAEWEKRGLQPQSPADSRLLLRRLHLDLVGLPPTRDELDNFARAHAANPQAAFEAVVDRLLASPHYGERWGRHWMDIWRYSDWYGLGQEVRNSQKHIWHWRDWIVESLNADKGYDQMVRELIAADELYPNDLDRLRATGYLARHYFIFNRTTWLDETVEHTAKAFLGLTFNCAKCHDHKYDPVRQTDYYRFRAFFEPYQVRTEMAPGETDFSKDGVPRAYDANLQAPTYLFFRGDDRQPVKDRVLAPGLPKLLLWQPLEIAPVSLPAEAIAPGLRPHVLDTHLKLAEKKIVAARVALAQAQKDLAAARGLEKIPSAEATKDSVLLRDDFSRADKNWRLGDGNWDKSAGKLRQAFPGEMRSYIEAKSKPPDDFQARFKFHITGGEPYRSVGISFDVAGDNEVLVYASAVAGGPRIQVAYKQPGGAYAYPPAASKPWPVPVNKPLELAVKVRGDLVNVSADGRFVLAYRLPVARKSGALQLITYAATAEFRTFELATLPAEHRLVQAGASKDSGQGPRTVEQALAAVEAAQAEIEAAELMPPALRAVVAADRAKFQQPQASSFKELAVKAGALQRQQTMAQQRAKLARDRLALLLANQKPKGPDAKKTVADPKENYTSLRGALKSPESNLEGDAARHLQFPPTSTGRRTALARWLTDRRNPLTARVAVNHVWGRHFGKTLVPTLFDFGRKGAPPTHPALLDYLAVEFMDNGWSMKHLHRLIVTSRVYALASTTAGADAKTRDSDGENRYYWRMNPIRMDAQVLRDSLLSLGGELDPRMGGPSIAITDEQSRRRSLYFVHSNNDNQRFLSMFDDASVRECYRRSESIVPQQALALANSKLALAMTAKITDRLQQKLGKADDTAFIRAAFETILATPPSRAELAECTQALQELGRLLKGRPDSTRRARADLVHALLNHNDFITVR
ncbi:MAG: DUF1553 domain-containing protein [Planctomycetes bacterium]|nr:DUF1553 domain-containing protein [Planctomycetota bacterium]